MALQSPTPAAAEPQPQRQAQVFEFTKRKKWTDILISELPDTVLLVLDTDGQIQYVGPNTNDVLGWEVEDLSETDVLDVVNDDDKRTFNEHFQKSLSSQHDLSCYARLKCKPNNRSTPEQGARQRELLFEIRGHALYLPDDNECKCFLLVAKPYPSRNMAVLNAFLELKIENEKLTQRVRDLKAQQDVMPEAIGDLPLPMLSSAMGHQQFATFEFPSRDGAMHSPSTASTTGSFSTLQTGFVTSSVPSTNARDEEGEEGGKKKKHKKNGGPAQQYVCVTCGRTDSPEWRKGPRGPKTLCNACGLRWAKRSKRTDDVPIPYVQEQSSRTAGQDGSRPPSTSSRGGRGVPVPHAALSVTPTEPAPVTSSNQQQQIQTQAQQGGYGGQVQAPPTPSPTHTTFSHQPLASIPTTPTTGHFAVHPMIPGSMHHQNVHSSTTSPAHGYLQSPAQPQAHYQSVYDHYQWPMNQHGEGGYQY